MRVHRLAAYVIGSVPVANLVAGTDLRRLGTVSATNVYRVAGLRPFALACLLDVVKGAAGAAGARSALGVGLVVAGHNWSVFLRGGGGRGVLPGLGALLVVAPEGAALLAAGIVAGHLTGDSAPGCFAAQVLMVPLLAATRGRRGALLGAAVAVPMLAKRLLGDGGRAPVLTRLVFDRDAR